MSYRREQRHTYMRQRNRFPRVRAAWRYQTGLRSSGTATGAGSLTTARLHVTQEHGLQVVPARPVPVRRPGDWAVMRTATLARAGAVPSGPRRFWPSTGLGKHAEIHWPASQQPADAAELGRGSTTTDT